jgi:hypothetical protein
VRLDSGEPQGLMFGGYSILFGAFLLDSLCLSIAGTCVAHGLPTAQGAGVVVVLSVEIIEAKEEREAFFFFFPSKIVREKGDNVAKTLNAIFFRVQVRVLHSTVFRHGRILMKQSFRVSLDRINKSSTQTKIGVTKQEVLCMSGDLRFRSACLLERYAPPPQSP